MRRQKRLRGMGQGQMLLARNVWRWREIRKVTASEVAEKIGWPLVELEALERADKPNITLDDIDRLALVLGIEPIDLFRREVH